MSRRTSVEKQATDQPASASSDEDVKFRGDVVTGAQRVGNLIKICQRDKNALADEMLKIDAWDSRFLLMLCIMWLGDEEFMIRYMQERGW